MSEGSGKESGRDSKDAGQVSGNHAFIPRAAYGGGWSLRKADRPHLRETGDSGAGTAHRHVMLVFRYLAALEGTKCILWCYLCWYVAIVLQYFDPAPGLWVSSAGIAGLIGFALNLAASQKGRKSDRWVVFRLYLFPFCVSSYSALIKGKGFFLLFPPDRKPLLIASTACLGFVALSSGCRLLARRSSKIKGTPA